MINDSFLYRKLSVSEIEAASELVLRVFEEFDAPDYTQDGIAFFKCFASAANISVKHNAGEIVLFGCFDRQRLAGVGAYRDESHICMMFVDKAYHKKGIAAKLFNCIKSDILSRCQGAKIMTVNAAPYAVGFYEKMGFSATAPARQQNGIIYTPMQLCL